MEQISSTNQNQKEGNYIMTTENNSTVEISNDVTETSKPKRTADEAAQDRINYHLNVRAEKTARLEQLAAAGKTGQKAYTRCLESLVKNDEVIAKLESSRAARQAKRDEKAAAKAAAAAAKAATVKAA